MYKRVSKSRITLDKAGTECSVCVVYRVLPDVRSKGSQVAILIKYNKRVSHSQIRLGLGRHWPWRPSIMCCGKYRTSKSHGI